MNDDTARDADYWMARLLGQVRGPDVAPVIHRLGDGTWCCHPWGRTHHSAELSHTGTTIAAAVRAAVEATAPFDQGGTDGT